MSAAGAAIGSAFLPGVGTALGALAGSLLDGEMSRGGGAAQQPPGTSSAATAVYGSGLNADNWAVNFSGTQRVSARADKALTASGPTASTAAMGGAVIPGVPGMPGQGLLNGVADTLGIDPNEVRAVPVWVWATIAGLVVLKLKSKK